MLRGSKAGNFAAPSELNQCDDEEDGDNYGGQHDDDDDDRINGK